jgi:mono/diheme cytochrome c family protein
VNLQNPRGIAATLATYLLSAALTGSLLAAAPAAPNASVAAPALFRQYCFGCHGAANASAGISLLQLTSHPSVGDNFQQWQRIVAALEQKRMPPPKLPQPAEADRQQALDWVRARLNDYAVKHAGDPGRVTVRRLTSGEYTYTISDLTGLDLKFDQDFASDSVGGEGFTNFGDVQFIDDANLERYLEAGRRIAEHAVIGSGPLSFFEHPGKSGFEMSAVSRIQEIYRANGFRAVAGEGAKPYGLDRYGKAFYAAWRYQHRQALGAPSETLEAIAAREGISPRFIRHIWSVLHQPVPTYPISDVAARWRSFPVPTAAADKETLAAARTASTDLQRFVIDWTRWVFAAGPMESAVGDDRVFVLTDESLKASTKETVRLLLRARGQKTARVYLSVPAMNPNAAGKPLVTWKNPSLRVLRRMDRRDPAASQPLTAVLSDGRTIDASGFTMAPDTMVSFEVPVPQGAFGIEVQFETEIADAAAGAVIRPTLSDREELGKGRTASVLLADPRHPGYPKWKAGLLEFAQALPQNTHGEPTPSDRDPIPPPFNNTYNQPERDRFHTDLKYYRTDRFLVDNILDDATRTRLDQAWNDLYASFDYHDVFLRFVIDKYKLPLRKKRVAELDDDDVAAATPEARPFISAVRAEYESVQKAQRAARTRHVDDCIEFAGRAWRRPLSKTEEAGLRAFYQKARSGPELEHGKAVRALLARVLVSPAFLYRIEQPAAIAGHKPVSDWELATRLSYFLWSSPPDEELRRAARAGQLRTSDQLEQQVKRMLADRRARRFATEFFGQWLGFYRFDQHRGVDSTRFPEFTDDVRSAMYDEAVSFFEHIVRANRAVREIFTADYTFLNQTLAKHYGVKKDIKATGEPELVSGAGEFHRGGLLRLGAVLTATSAPLRTSPVKRGDWVLRRILGTPTPPPPADAGSIPADEKAFGGLTLFERLEVHKRNASCAGCHTRIDPLGFPLERYDAVGRWRDK